MTKRKMKCPVTDILSKVTPFSIDKEDEIPKKSKNNNQESVPQSKVTLFQIYAMCKIESYS